MDSNEFYSPGSRTHQSSFGLLDDKAIQDLSMENLHKVRDKPPIPFKQISKNILQARQMNQDKSLNFDTVENSDQTQESVHLNESDLRQLEYEYTFDANDDDDDDKENLKSYKTKLNDLSDSQFKDLSKNFGYSFAKTDFTNVSPHNFADMDKSVNFTLSENKVSDNKSSNLSNDLLMDESSNILRNSSEFDATNADQSNQMCRINYDRMDEINEKCNKTQNSTLNFTVDPSIQNQSGSKTDFTFSDLDVTSKAKQTNTINENENKTFNYHKDKTSNSFNLSGLNETASFMNRLSLDKKEYEPNESKQFSDSTFNFSSDMSDRINQLVQQSVERVKRIGQAHLINSTEDYLNLMSKPQKDSRYSTSTVRSEPKDTSLNFTQNTVLLSPSKTFNQTIKPQEEPKIPEDIFKKPNNPFDDSSLQKSQNFNPQTFENPFDNSLGNFGKVNNLDETSSNFGFKDAGDFMSQLNQDEQINRKEFADNELTLINQTTSNTSNDSNSSKWWKNSNIVQPNQLEISNVSNVSQQNKKQVKVDDFFMGKSELPSYLAEKESDVNLSSQTVKTDKTILQEDRKKENCMTPQNVDDITFSSNNQGSTLSSSNFSFTLNSSESGDFIQPISQSSKTPFQLTKALENLNSKKKEEQKNLDKINEELDRVHNRLANKHQMSEPLMSSSIKVSQTSQNLKSMIQMDETISSINSSDITTQKIKKSDVKTGKDSKSKASSGSLTSTPSKMTKSISESSNLNGLTATSLMEKFYKSDNQDSFISSIPERNDSTLISSHHHHKLKSKNHKSKQKNVEIQTTPDSIKLPHDDNRQSISNVSSTSSTSSDPSSTMNTQFNVINNLAAAMINNSTNSNNPANGLVPVAFIPLNSFIPCVQKFYDDMQTTQGLINKTNLTSNMSTNSLNQAMNTKLFVDTVCSSSTSSLPSLNYGKFELPMIEFDKNLIDFGQVAEGCSQSLRIHGQLQNSTSINKTPGSYFQIELVDSTDWSIETYDRNSDEKAKKLEDEKQTNKVSIIKKKFNEFTLKSKFRKTLSIFPDKNYDLQSSNSKVQFELMSNFYEFFIQLNTKDLSFYKDLISQLDPNSVEQLEPLEVKTSLYIYYYFNNSNNFTPNSTMKKYLLNRIDVKFILGYARLRTNANIDSIEFEIPDEIMSTSVRHESYTDDGDKTLTSVNELSLSKNSHILEQFIPLSNGGNIDIEVECYLSQNDQHSLSIKTRDLEIKLDDSLLFLQAKSKQKQFARLLASKLTMGQMEALWDLNKLDNIKFTVEIKPNGFKFEIPISLKYVKKVIDTRVKNENKIVKLASSRSILFFGKALNSSLKNSPELSGMNDEFTVANSNTFRIKVQFVLTTNNGGSLNCFKFSNEMIQSGTQLNEAMTQMNLILEPSENIRLKIKFEPSHSFDSSIVIGLLKMSAQGFNQKFNVHLVGFLSQSFLELDNGLKELTCSQSEPLNQQLIYRNIKNFKYPIEFMQTSTSSLKNIYRKIIRLKNKSTSSKLVVYPCLFNNKLNKEIAVNNNNGNKSLKTNEITYDLGIDSKSYVNRLRLLVNKESLFSSNLDLNWIEIKPDETFSLNLEIISQKIDSNKCEYCNLEDFNLCLFWIEYDINAYCTQSVLNSNSNSKQSTNFIDSFLAKLLLNNNFFTTQNNLGSLNINDVSSAKLNRLSSISTASLQDQSSLSNNSFLTSKSKFTRDDYLRLMRQSIKCSSLNLMIQTFNFDETLDKKDDLLQVSLNRDEKTSDLTESWSVNPSVILVENLKPNETSKIYLKNNLSRKTLEFDVKYRSNFLSVLPSNGCLEPNGCLELIVKPRNELFAQLPWSGVISIFCNKIQKDIRISFYSNKSDIELQKNLELSKIKNMTNSSLSSLAPSLTSNSTPYSNSIESGTIISDLSQYTLDSLSLTPLISASFINPPSNSFSVNKSKSFNLNNSSNNDESITKIVREGNDAHVRFPPCCVTQRKSVELTLTNPTTNYVNWKAFSTVPAYVKLKDEDNKFMKSNYSVFIITPNSGTIPANQNQKIKIEFCPRDVYGQFNQNWEIDTRTDIQSLRQKQNNEPLMSFSCKLILTGTSIPIEKNLEQKLVDKDNEISSRLANRILRSKTNSFNDTKKENERSYIGNNKSTSSVLAQSILSSTTNASLNSSSTSKNRVIIKDEIINFPDTEINQMSKCFVTIHNRESTECKISVFTLMEPFCCKHADLMISSKHYIKIPIEFKPKSLGEYTDKILIRVDKYDVPLSCVVKAKCVQS
ncbi:unnamed protein product [Brachionus calyciflorus]|uniref:Uncharacterized protein n=1 Tax=Brachionus calyciflorus TaxID=104777 RepID=A0A813RKB7_9BILA|nr:unnamed protein product [Brachionus calyciflorus]